MACVAGGLKTGGLLLGRHGCVRQRMFIFNLFVVTIMQVRNILGEGKFYYKYECRRDKLSVLNYLGKRRESLYISVQVRWWSYVLHLLSTDKRMCKEDVKNYLSH